MISVKIECPCGQHYAFEVEPVNGRMPAPVACPACSADGSAAANEFIAQQLAQPVTLSAPPPSPASQVPRPVSLAASIAPTSSRRAPGLPLPGQPDRNQVMFEARAKISWGDSPEEVLKYLLIQGFAYQEAAAAVQEMFDERTAAIRSRGVVYILAGMGLICVPILSWFVALRTSAVYYWGHSSPHMTPRAARGLVITIGIGLGGIGLLIKGLFMFFSPRSSSGDVAEH